MKKSSPEMALLCAMLKNPTVHLKLESFTQINWELFYKLILRHRLWHRLEATLVKTLAEVHNSPQTQQFLHTLKQHCWQDSLRILALVSESLRLTDEFALQGVEHIFLKGISLNYQLYGGLSTRPCRDIDILVSPKTYNTAIHILLASGYQQKSPIYPLVGLKKDYHFKHRYDIAFYHPQKKILVELHFKLKYLGIAFFPFDKIERQLNPVEHKKLSTMEDDYHLLYLILHGATHGWNRLRWLEDIYLFVQAKQGHLTRVFQLAHQIHCTHVVEQALLLLKCFFDCDHLKIDTYLKAPSKQAKQLKEMAAKYILADYEQIDSLKNPRIFLMYRRYLIKLAPDTKKLAALSADLLKIHKVFPLVSFSDRFFWMYYVIYPWWPITYIVSNLRKQQ